MGPLRILNYLGIFHAPVESKKMDGRLRRSGTPFYKGDVMKKLASFAVLALSCFLFGCGAAEEAATTVGDGVDAVGGAVAEGANAAVDGAVEAGSAAVEAGKDGVEAVGEGIEKTGEAIKNAASDEE